MCVIIAKASKVKAPALSIIKAAIATNPHGNAISWIKDGKLETFKTLSAEEMIDYYTSNYEALCESSFVFHARIATNGSKRLENCHGWSTFNGRMAFFHNGILNIESRGDLTDSETFLRDIYEPIALTKGHKAAEPAIRAVIGSSKFAFINSEGGIKLYGHYTEREGVYYSNLNFEYNLYRATHHTPYPSFWSSFDDRKRGFATVKKNEKK